MGRLWKAIPAMNRLRPEDGVKQVVLVVDDDAGVRDSLKFTLEVEGFEVRTYSSAEALLSESRLPANSCLVTDYQMPSMNGLELIAQLRDRRVSVPGILITSLPNENLGKRAAAAGISNVEKPLMGSRLLDSLHQARFCDVGGMSANAPLRYRGTTQFCPPRARSGSILEGIRAGANFIDQSFSSDITNVRFQT
jgi:CheY-like chemotaxis protein